MARLRHIAVHVEEPKPGRFAWVLSERGEHGWQALDTSAAPRTSYRQAMADGLLALQSLVDDLDAGPRSADGTATEDKPAAARSYFGFGPAR